MGYHPGLGVWVERDPKGYVDGPNLYQYELSNPVNHLDPEGTKARFSVDAENGIVTATLNIMLKDKTRQGLPDIFKEIIGADVESSIEETWSGIQSSGGCTFIVQVNIEWGSGWDGGENTIGIQGDGNFRSFVRFGNTGNWGTSIFGPLESMDADRASDRWEFAHEAGHLMGLPDDYTDAGGPNSGHEGHMMGQYWGQVVTHEIDDILMVNGISCTRKCDE